MADTSNPPRLVDPICLKCNNPIFNGQSFWAFPNGSTAHTKCLKIKPRRIPKKFGNCEVCGDHGQIETHHIFAKYRGGGNNPINLIDVCLPLHKALTHTLKDPSHSTAPELMRDRLRRVKLYIDKVNRTRPFHLELTQPHIGDKWVAGGRLVGGKLIGGRAYSLKPHHQLLHHYFVVVNIKTSTGGDSVG